MRTIETTVTTGLNGLFSNLSRAYEIAKLGNLSIQVVYGKEYLKGAEDYQLIKEFFKGVEFSINGDIIFEIFEPEYSNNHRCEPMETVENRILQGSNNPIPKNITSDNGRQLLKVAVDRLNLSLKDIERIEKISIAIAQLENSDVVKLEHLAEAIQYRSYYNDGIIAESNSMNFGGIIIPLTELDSFDINNAIKYLQSL